MEEKANSIINKLTNVLSGINPAEFMSKIKTTKDCSKILEISKDFCEIITNIKAQILFDISEEIHSLVKEKDNLINDDDVNNINLNDDLNNKLITKIKNTLPQIKFKIINLYTDISELNSNLIIISGNLKKQKYSLATSRLEKLFKLKDNMQLNINSLEKLENKFSDSLKINKNIVENNNNLKTNIIKTQIPKTPSPFGKNKNNIIKSKSFKKNEKTEKNLSSNKLLKYPLKKNSFQIIKNKSEKKLSNFSTEEKSNKTNIKIQNNKKENKNEINNLNNKDKIIRAQKEIIKNLEDKIEHLNEKKKNNCNNNEKDMKIKLENKALLYINRKLIKISDLVFSITFSINNIQNNNLWINEEYNNIKNNLINITTEISEIKTNILKMSLENENIFINENKEDIDNNNLNIKAKKENEELYHNKIKYLQKENENLKLSIEKLKIKIISFPQNLSLEENQKFNNNEKIEISSLKDKLILKEKKLKELKELYEADINSKNIIEKLLKKNIDDIKESYELKINKLNKKLEEKEKEIMEKNNLINKMNYKKLKSLNTNEDKDIKRLSYSTYNDDILKINDELSKVRFGKENKNDLSLENSISLSLFKEKNEEKDNNEENDKKETKMKKLEDEIILLKSINKKMNNELNDLKNEIK